MEWVRGLCLDTIFIKNDFEKAYDRVEWPFMLAMFKYLGLMVLFLCVVETLIVEPIPLFTNSYNCHLFCNV
jgi:hypothetical protein